MLTGIDNSEVEYIKQEPKGIGNSITLAQDISSLEKLDEILLALTEQVAYRLRKHHLFAQVVNVQIKNSDFKVYSHQRKIDYPENTTKGIYNIAKELLRELYKGEAIRLIGVRVEKLCNENEVQLSLFSSEDNKKQEKLDKTLDSLKEKYGNEFITRAGKMNIDKMINLKE